MRPNARGSMASARLESRQQRVRPVIHAAALGRPSSGRGLGRRGSRRLGGGRQELGARGGGVGGRHGAHVGVEDEPQRVGGRLLLGELLLDLGGHVALLEDDAAARAEAGADGVAGGGRLLLRIDPVEALRNPARRRSPSADRSRTRAGRTRPPVRPGAGTRPRRAGRTSARRSCGSGSAPRAGTRSGRRGSTSSSPARDRRSAARR